MIYMSNSMTPKDVIAQVEKWREEWKNTIFSDEILNKTVIKGKLTCVPLEKNLV